MATPPKPAKKYPSREKIVYVAVPREYGAMLDALTAEGGKHEGRSRAYLAKMALKAFLQSEGLLDERGKPIGGG